ncbi:PH domain-containing protein [Corynebacterium minutissimum]
MTQITRNLIAPDHDVLTAIAEFIQSKFPKVELDTQSDRVTAQRKVLWQKQEATFHVADNTLVASGNCQDSDNIVYKTLFAIESMIDDHGWDEAARTHGTKSVAKGHLLKGQVLDALEPAERIVVATHGFCEGKATVLTVTDKRILVISGEAIGWDTASQTIALDKVSSISEKAGLALGSIRISTSNSEIELEKVATNEAKAVVAAARRVIDQTTASSPAPETSSGVGVDDLTKLAELHAAGVLTDEEFAAAKAKALGL